MRYKTIFIYLTVLLAACNGNDTPENDPDIVPRASGITAPANILYTILAQHPHDTGAYTQGLELYKGKLYESTGDYQSSSIRITDWKTGKLEKIQMMGTDKIFGEGLTILKSKVYQLTWENNIVYVYDVNNIEKPIRTFNWPYAGWGITNNGTDLIISDGSSNLYLVNPEDFRVKSTLSVQDNRGPVRLLNELEFIDGSIYANVYETNLILKIDPETGHVLGQMNLPGLLQSTDIVSNRTDVLNGIAYDSLSKTFLITGKRWPKLFEIKLN